MNYPRIAWTAPPLVAAIFFVALLRAGLAHAADWPINAATASSSTATVLSATDNNLATGWSSAASSVAQRSEWISITFDTSHQVNYVKFAPQYAGGSARGFPIEFDVELFTNSAWFIARSFTHYPIPTQTWFSLTLPTDSLTNQPVIASAVRVTARVLGSDNLGAYSFQLAELRAGYDPAAGDLVYTPSSVVASSALWPAENAMDGNGATIWSSITHTSNTIVEWMSYWWPQGFQAINAIKVLPRYDGSGRALGFPVDFKIYYSNGTSWVLTNTVTAFPPPYEGAWIILPLGHTVIANGISIDAITLGDDGVGNYVFQLAEVQAEYNDGFTQLAFQFNNGSSDSIGFTNIGSEPINRLSQAVNWVFDDRGVVIPPLDGGFQNTYAPTTVQTSPGHWNIYFGGWDGSASNNDRISMTTTADDFTTFGPHALVVDNGVFVHVNNACVVHPTSGPWRMAYTTKLPGPPPNRTAYAMSSDGRSWTPFESDEAHYIGMVGYPNWSTADVNGTNVIYLEPNGVWHLYFDDNNNPVGHLHATSTDGVNYVYQGVVSTEVKAVNDFKAFTYGGSSLYYSLFHHNAPTVWISSGTSLSSIPPTTEAFSYQGTTSVPDEYITSAGFVQDGSRIFGMLYGASAVTTLDVNRIYARWLQKLVSFHNGNVGWGGGCTRVGPPPFPNYPCDSDTRSVGPDAVKLRPGRVNAVETGRVRIDDTDWKPLYTSPLLTTRAGDVWRYAAPQPYWSCTVQCANKCAGAPDGCGGVCPTSQCAAGSSCPGDVNGNCLCTPNCANACGGEPDGCGHSCPPVSCGGGYTCSSGACVCQAPRQALTCCGATTCTTATKCQICF